FRLGIGGPLGHGRQWWSWISLADLLAVLRFAIEGDDLQGPVNVVAPEVVRQRAFARAIGRALHRPAFLPTPGFALRAMLGRGQADEMLLAGARVRPGVLAAAGFAFRDPQLGPALEGMIGRAPSPPA